MGLVRSAGMTWIRDTENGCGGRRRGGVNRPLAYDHNLPSHTRDLSDQISARRTLTPVRAGLATLSCPCLVALLVRVADQWGDRHRA